MIRTMENANISTISTISTVLKLLKTVEIVENSTIGVQQLKNQRSFFSELKKPNSKIYTYHTKPDPTENPSENSKIHGFGPGSGPGPGSTLIALFYY